MNNWVASTISTIVLFVLLGVVAGLIAFSPTVFVPLLIFGIFVAIVIEGKKKLDDKDEEDYW